MGTLVCGYFACLATLKATELLAAGASAELSFAAFDAAAKAIGWAILFDGLDGRIARLTNSSSDFGREFDSLADVVAFGIAPAFLAFAWGVRGVETTAGSDVVEHLRQLGWLVTFGFVICGAGRLARFNIQSTRATADKRHFVGLPIPGAAGLIAAIVHWEKYPLRSWTSEVAWLFTVGLLAFLMVSRVRYPTFKVVDLRRPRSYLAIIFIALIVWVIYAYSEPVLLAIALTYAIYGPVARLIWRLRRRRSLPPAPEEVHAS